MLAVDNLAMPEHAGMQLPDYPDHSVQVRYATEHRCGVVIRGPDLTDAISGTDPLKDNLPLRRCSSLDNSPEVSRCSAAP
jgi:2,3-bisphosphoglycerate-independent phosphoglycerate mutase